MSSATAATLSHNIAFTIFVLGVFGLCAFMLGVSSLLGSRAVGRSKHEPFESGMLPVGSARLRFSAKFYLVAMLFVIFDVEVLFLYAWAVSARESGWFGLGGAAIFITILFAGLVYEGAIGALDWAPMARKKAKARHAQ